MVYRSEGSRRGRTHAAVLATIALSVTACSVSTPRHGAAPVAQSVVASNGPERTESSAAPAQSPGGIAESAGPLNPTQGPFSTPAAGPGLGTSGPGASPYRSAPPRGGSSVGVNGQSVTISVTGPWSGPSGDISRQVSESGFSTWADDVNARGGVQGRRVVIKYINNEGTPEGGVAACKQIRGNGSFLAWVIMENLTLTDCLDQAHIPNVSMAVPTVKSWRWTKAQFLDTDRGKLVASFVAGPLGGAHKKIGVIYLKDAIQSDIATSFIKSARERGMDVVDAEPVAPGQSSFTAELQRLRAKGAQVVGMFVLIESLGILRDAKAIQYAPTFTGSIWCVDEFSLGAVELFRGIKCLRQYTGTESPAYQQFRAKARATGHQPDTTAAWAVYGNGLLLERLLHAAGKQPTRESFMAAFETVGPIDNGVQPVMRWGSGRVVGSKAQFPVLCCHDDRTWQGIGPAREAF